MPHTQPITNVSDTALWVAMYRAYESEREDALFDDPHARHMAGPRGEAIVRALPHGEAMAWTMTVRTAVIDKLVLDAVARGARSVINLGAGLDTRAFRLKLPATLRWLDVDLPDMVAHRRDCLGGARPACEHAHVAADVSDDAALDALLAATPALPGPILVLTEGLLIYLSDAQVRRLATRLRADERIAWWAADLISPWLLATAGARWGAQLGAAGAPFRFAPPDRARFFEPLGWREQEFRSIWDESVRLDRAAPMASWWTAFGQPWMPAAHKGLRALSGISLLAAGGQR